MQKVANYRRAIWLSAGGPTLQTYLQTRLDSCEDVAATKFEYKPDVAAQIPARSAGQGLGVYITLFAEGSPAATVENGGPNLHRRNAPQGEEFLKTGIYLVIEGNHAGFIANGMTNDGQITGLLHKFMKARGATDTETQFALFPRADRREIEALVRQGVKSIDLGLTAFEATVQDAAAQVHNEQQTAAGVVKDATLDFGRGLMRIFGNDRSPQEIEAASEIQARIHLGFDGRNSSALIPLVLGQIGETIVNSDEEFRIVTTTDAVITRDKLVIRREVNVDGDDVTIDPTSAFAAIRMAMTGWRQAGLFEQ